MQTYVISSEEIAASDASTPSELAIDSRLQLLQQTNSNGAMGYKNTVRGLNVESRYLLVLVDGRRCSPAFAPGHEWASGAHNVNAVPLDLIERVEVNGPSSALYGSMPWSGC